MMNQRSSPHIPALAAAALLTGCVTSSNPPILSEAAALASTRSTTAQSSADSIAKPGATELMRAHEIAARLRLTQVASETPGINTGKLLSPKPFNRQILVQYHVPDHTVYNRTGIVSAMIWPDNTRVKYTFYDTATTGDIGTGTDGSIYDSFLIPVPANHWVTLHKNKHARLVKILEL